MSYSYNQTRKNERMKARISKMTVEDYKKLRPDEVKTHKKIVDFIKENGLTLKLK